MKEKKVTTKGRRYKQSLKTKLRRRIAALVGERPNLIADKYCSQIANETEEYGTKREISRELEDMIRERLLVQTTAIVNGKVFDNISLPIYRFDGKVVSIHDLVNHKFNTQGLCYDVIRNRLLQGCTPSEALYIKKGLGRGKLKAAVYDYHNEGSDELF